MQSMSPFASSSRHTTPALSPSNTASSSSSSSSSSFAPSPVSVFGSPNAIPTVGISSRGFLIPVATRSLREKSNTKSHAKKKPAGHVPRPRNSFILFRLDVALQGVFQAAIHSGTVNQIFETAVAIRRAQHAARMARSKRKPTSQSGKVPTDKGKDKIPSSPPTYQQKGNETIIHHEHMSRFAALLWETLTPEEKQPWVQFAKEEQEQHRILFPGFRHLTSQNKRDPTRAGSARADEEDMMQVDEHIDSIQDPWDDNGFSFEGGPRPEYFTLYTERSLMEKIFDYDSNREEEGKVKMSARTLFEFIAAGGVEKLTSETTSGIFPCSRNFEVEADANGVEWSSDSEFYDSDDEVQWGAWQDTYGGADMTVPVPCDLSSAFLEDISAGLPQGLPAYSPEMFQQNRGGRNQRNHMEFSLN